MKKILIVDDDPIIVRLLHAHLRAAGYRISAAADAIQGIQMAIAERPDLILLDLQMPAGGGAGVFEALTKNVHTALIPVVFVTANRDGEVREACLASGAADFVNKPINPADLLVRIRRVLGESETPPPSP
ncbi:MAG: response regulator [Verrucomicrobia bacterium]|nr:response regulator [Verrucomicrobiota bacterium]